MKNNVKKTNKVSAKIVEYWVGYADRNDISRINFACFPSTTERPSIVLERIFKACIMFGEEQAKRRIREAIGQKSP